MALAGTIRAQGILSGSGTGKREIDLAWVFTNAIEWDETVLATSGGPTLFALQSGASICILIPPPTNANAWSYSIDGGVSFLAAHLTMPVILTVGGVTSNLAVIALSTSVAIQVAQF